MRGLTALLLLVSVAMCFALSKNEIEEFTEYLWKTSVLDQNLKDGTNFAHDEEEEVPDHAWEESGKFEGDLILNERQRRLIAEDVAEGLSRNGLRDSTKRWPNNEVIFYIQREHFSGDQVEAIKEGIDDLSRASCIKFRPYKKGDRDAVVIQGSRRGCFSQVGYQGGYQVLNLSGRHPVGRGCFRHGTVVHELLHTLGFYHMQSSHDRDEFIDVRWENIVQPARHNFRKYNAFSVSDFGVGYDYDSVLHYSRRAFSSNGGDTLVPKQSGAQIGQRVGLSDKDTQKLNKMYCDADSNNSDTAAQQPLKPIKTKTTRNQPFQGHGIGYHQGKTLVIKVPVAETLKLPDSPSYAVFDYFSKASQALPPALVQGLGVGKEIAYRSPASEFNTKKHQQVGNNEPKITAKEKPNAAEEFFKSLAGSKDVERKPTTNKSKHNDIPHKGESKVNEELLEAFERLGKIIRTHVYPLSKPDTTTYNFNKDYSKFYNPESKKHESKAKKIDEIFSHRPKKPEKIETKEKLSGDADKEEQKHNDTSNVKDVAFISPLYNKIYGEVDSSFGTSLPFKKPVKETFKLSSKYSEPADENEFAHVKNYDDYSHLYKPKIKSLRSESEKPYYTLFGDPVPLKENWYRENYKKPKYDSSEKELGQYGEKVMKNSKSEREAKEKYEKYIKDKDVLSIPYENKYSSKEDLPSIEHSYEENSEEKQYDKFGHVGNSKIQGKKKDSSEHNSEYRYPELAKLYKYDFSSGEEEYDYNEKLGTSNPSNSSNEDHIGTKTSKRPVDNKYTKHGTSEEDELEKDAYNEDDNEKDKPTLLPRKSHTLNYRVTEEPEEKDHEMPAKESHDGTKSVEDYSSFGSDMDDRLSTILKNYDSIDDFDIELPYHSRQESSESAEHAVRLTDSNHASTTETTKYRHDNNPVN